MSGMVTRRAHSEARPLRIAVVGVHGYGAAHVLTALRLQQQGRAELVALVDPLDGPIVREGRRIEAELPAIVPDLDDVLQRRDIDVAVVATPLHTHAGIAARALRSGADVLLEKPPVTDLATFESLRSVQRQTGGLIQVGFQSLGSLALVELKRLIEAGELGVVEAIGAAGTWTRDHAYWTRARWAGRRELDGVRVSDGAVSNPFAHAVMTALRIAGWNDASAIDAVEADLYRVNEIDVDDTSTLRVHPSITGRGSFGGVITCAFTLAGPREDVPFIRVRGSKGTAVLHYTEDLLAVNGGQPRRFDRVDLMENLIDARAGRAELFSPLDAAGAFVSIIEEVARTPVHPIAPSFAQWHGSDESRHPVVEGVVTAVERALKSESLFRELDEAPWAR
jgi:predicted dehydrogenase